MKHLTKEGMAKHCSQNEKDAIIKLFKNSKIEKAYRKLSQLLDKYPKDYELHYIAGMIHGSQFRYTEALESFNKALALNPKHALLYREVGIIHMTLCRYHLALSAFKRAKKLDPRLQDVNHYLREINKIAKPKDITLSACLIVKNEEKHLANCLKSIQAVTDEIVVVDTGSEDRSIEIAQSFGAKVLHFAWKKDFAAARNFAIQQATGDWILQIDADEELVAEDQFKVREVMHQGKCDAAFVALRNRTSSLFGETRPTVHYLIRLYRNRHDIYYVNPVHETLKVSGEILPTDINFLHHGYNLNPDYMRIKRRRNAEILYRRFQDDPNHVTTLFYLSMLHLADKNYDLSAEFAKRVLEKLTPDDVAKQHIYLMALNNLVLISVEKQDYEPAKDYCREAINLNENYLDPQYFLGVIYFRESNFKKAKEVFHNYLEKFHRLSQNPVFNLFSHASETYLFQIYHFLGKIYRKEKKYVHAEQMFSKAVELNPNFWIGYTDLGYLHLELENWQKAAQYLEHAIKLAQKNPEVNKRNSVVWFDYANLLKNYVKVLKNLHGLYNQISESGLKI